jgi:hypothetical protein
MADALLDLRDADADIGLVPTPVQVLGDHAKLYDEIIRKVFGRGFPALLAPKAQELGFIVAHNDPSVRAA